MSTDAPAAGGAAALLRGAGRRRAARGAAFALAALYSAVVIAWFAGNRLLGDVWWLMPLTAAPQALLAPWPFALLAALWARSRAALAGVAMVGVVLAAAFGGLFLPKPAPPPAPDTFRLVTHNLLYTNGALDQEEAAIRALAPDAVTLQEVQPSQWRALTAALRDLYPYAVIAERQPFGTTAILSRRPFTDTGSIVMDARLAALGITPRHPSRPILWADLDVDGRPVRLISAHLVPKQIAVALAAPLTFPATMTAMIAQHQEEVRAIGELVAGAQASGGAVFIGCDCNMTDQNPDYRALAAMGLRDTFREVGWGFGYTSVQGPSRSVGDVFRYYARLDYVWHSADTDAVAIEIVDMPTGSDHHPLLATLGWR